MGNKANKADMHQKTKYEVKQNFSNEEHAQNYKLNYQYDQNKQIKHFNNSISENIKIKEETKSTRHSIEVLNINNIMEVEVKKDKICLKTVGGSLFQDIRKIYKFKEVLGGGHFGTVRIAYKRSEENKRGYAIKSISKKNFSQRDLEDLTKEVEIISSLDHPNIIKFFETYHDEFYFHIVMELCSGKEVFDKILIENHLTETKVKKIIYKVISAINYCHTKGVTHRDIKPENILFESAEADADIKLIDFGLSRNYNSNEKMHTILGTPYYIAPEVLKGDYDEKCDVWSIGAITFIMLCGEPPFIGKTNNEIFKKIVSEEVTFEKSKWKKISNHAKNFIRECMHKNADKRFCAETALNHSWFKTLHVEDETATLEKDILVNIKNFSTPQKFKKLVLRFLVNMLSHKELKDLKKAFNAIDTDHSGFININELHNAFKQAKIKISEEEIKNIIANSDEKDKLDYTEFILASLNQKKLVDKDKLISAFKHFDMDDSGFIDASDVKNALLRSGKKIINSEDIDVMLAEVTSLNQPKVSLEDFLNLFDISKL
jgi:calcium-dependent protein kinase